MTSTALTTAEFAYIECEVPQGQTLTEWRRCREENTSRRRFRRLGARRRRSVR